MAVPAGAAARSDRCAGEGEDTWECVCNSLDGFQQGESRQDQAAVHLEDLQGLCIVIVADNLLRLQAGGCVCRLVMGWTWKAGAGPGPQPALILASSTLSFSSRRATSLRASTPAFSAQQGGDRPGA